MHFLEATPWGPSPGPTCWRSPTSLWAMRRMACSGFDTGGLAMPGGGIAPLLLNSPTFGPTIQMSVLTAGSFGLKAAFTAYAPNCKTAVPTCFVNEFLPSQDAAPGGAASTLQSYSFAAQSVLDSADPINLGSGIAADFPLFATEIVGDGALSLSDR